MGITVIEQPGIDVVEYEWQRQMQPPDSRYDFHHLARLGVKPGDHVVTLQHDDRVSSDAGQTSWNLISKNNQDTVSGIYLYHVESAIDGSETIGKFVIIR